MRRSFHELPRWFETIRSARAKNVSEEILIVGRLWQGSTRRAGQTSGVQQKRMTEEHGVWEKVNEQGF